MATLTSVIGSTSAAGEADYINQQKESVATPPETDTAQQIPASPGNDVPSKKLSSLQIATIMTCLCACVFVSALDVTIITTAAATIAHEFNSSSGYTWIGSAFTLAHTASTPSWGKLSDIWGRKPLLLWATAFFFFGSLICALVKGMDAFIAGRALQGLGAGGMATIVNICISDMFSQRDRSVYFALTSLVWALACGVGPVIGGVFTTKIGWRWCFWINLPISGSVIPLLYLTLQLPNPKTPIRAGLKAVDWVGSFLIIGGAIMLLLGLHLGGVTDPWNSATIVCLIVFGFVAGVLFIVNEWKFASYPVIPLRLFQDRSSAAAFAVCFFQAFSFMGVAYYLPLYFQAVLLKNPLISGVYLLPFIVSSPVAAALTGWYIQRSGKYLPPTICGLVAMALGIGLLIDLQPDTDWVKLIIYQIIGGCGFGATIEGPLLAVQSAASADDVAVATASMGFVRTISTAISIVVGGVVFQNEMGRQKEMLQQKLGTEIAHFFEGSTAAANLEVVKSLPVDQREVVRQAFYRATRSMWFLYVAFAAVGLLVGLLVRGNHLSTDHEMTKVGLQDLDTNQTDNQRRNNYHSPRGSTTEETSN